MPLLLYVAYHMSLTVCFICIFFKKIYEFRRLFPHALSLFNVLKCGCMVRVLIIYFLFSKPHYSENYE